MDHFKYQAPGRQRKILILWQSKRLNPIQSNPLHWLIGWLAGHGIYNQMGWVGLGWIGLGVEIKYKEWTQPKRLGLQSILSSSQFFFCFFGKIHRVMNVTQHEP